MIGFSVNAQNDSLEYIRSISSPVPQLEELLNRLPIRQDQRITDLLVRHAQINQKNHGLEGYRLEIFFGSGSKAREQAMHIRNEFYLSYPEMPAYLSFQTPNFKVRVGDFRNKSDALKTKELISLRFPNAFIVKDMIQFPELYPETLVETDEQ
jgi:hypothetical protein